MENVYFTDFTDFKVLGGVYPNRRFPQSTLGGSGTQQ